MSIALRHLIRSAVDGPFGSALTSSHYADEGARVIRLGNIGVAEWRDEDTAYVPLDYWRELVRHEASEGDLVIAGLGDASNPLGRAAVVPDVGPAMVKADCFRLRPDPSKADARFLAYYMSSRGAELAAERAHGSTRQRLPLGEMLALPVPELPVEVQRRIANYLDAETARIDALLSKNEQVRALLAERRASFLEELCWTDEAPRVPLAYVCDPTRPIRYGIVLPGPSVDDGVPLIKAGDVHDRTLESGTKSRVAQDVEARYTKSRVHPGDLVYTIRGSYGEVAVVPPSLPVANLTQDVARIAPQSAEAGWLALVLAAPSARSQAETVARGATISGVNIEDLRSMRVPVLPVEEQRARMARAREVLEPLDAVVDRTQVQDALLRERRQALVTAAVTGELEV